MYKKIIISTIIGLVVLVVVWSEYHSPARQVRPVQGDQQPASDFSGVVDEIGHMIICPDPECTAKGVEVAHSNCETSTMLRNQMGMMLQNGLTKDGVIAHLRMLGLIPGDPGLPEGHPSMGGVKDKG